MAQWLVSLPERLDTFLASEGRMLSRGKAQRAIEEGRVSVNDGVVTKSSARLQEGDTVTVIDDLADAESSHLTIQPSDLHLPILYEDSSCLVINKPAGIAVHPGAGMAPGEKTMLNGIAFLFEKRSLPFSAQSVLVHRLDKDTTGCLLIAKNPEAHLALQKQFEDRTVTKIYLALVAGVPSPASAVIDAPIGRNMIDRTTMSILRATAHREAQTTYKTLAVSAKRDASLLSCELHTGRTHQIRVHLSAIGHPVLGDGTYTSTLSERVSQDYDIHDLCLHAWKLSFVSPADASPHGVQASLPSSLKRALQTVQITWDEE